MKKILLILLSIMTTASLFAQKEADKDSLRMVKLDEVQIISTRATSKTPVAFVNIKEKDIKKVNLGKDIPFILSLTPSVLTTSDAGAGMGYTSIRVRGTDATRINITSNGIPMNDAESHAIFWVNTPDLASSLKDIQIQRGAGTSTNGAGAFGASINMKTQSVSPLPYAEIQGSAGSYDSFRQTYKVGTGLINNHFGFDARISSIKSDGYRDRASVNLKSYFAQGAYFGDNTVVKFITFGGKEKTYHAWDGISREMLKKERKYNPNGEIWYGKKFGGFYKDQTDNYRQTHYQLLVDHRFSPSWNMNLGLHYTNGYGYYQEYKNKRKLIEYGIQPFTHDGEKIKKSNLIRRKIVSSDFAGGVFSFNYGGEKIKLSLGGGLNRYINDHYGKVLSVMNYIGQLDPDHEYYRNQSQKTDGNIYARANWSMTSHLSIYGDLQYRHILYTIKGINDNYDWRDGHNEMQPLNIRDHFNFLNPKAGLHYAINQEHSLFASFAVAQKEPTRNNYTDGMFDRYPKAEKMLDYEIGYNYHTPKLSLAVNLYYMDYKDQLVLNGRLNDIGEAMAENVDRSYRAGIETSLAWQPAKWLKLELNNSLSRNRIKDYTGYATDWNTYQEVAFNVGNTPIAFSPTRITSGRLSFTHRGFEASWQTQDVSRQYLDNFGSREDSLDPYCVNNLSLNYTFSTKTLKNVSIGATIYNILNEKYETNGYAMTSASKDANDKYIRKSDPRFYPMAGTNIMTNINIRF